MQRFLIPLLFVILSGTAITAFPQDQATTASPELLFEPTRDYGFQFSPDGNYLAFITKDGPYHFLMITDLKRLEIVFKHLLSDIPVENVYWLSNNRLLYEYIGQIKAINMDGTEHKTLISYVYDPEKIRTTYQYFRRMRTWEIVDLADGEEIVVRSVDKNGYMHIHRVNVYSGEKVDIINGKDWEIQRWVTDLNGDVRLGIRSIDGENQSFSVSFKNEKAVLTPVTFENGKYKAIVKGDSVLDQRVEIGSFSADKNIVYLSENINSDTYRLVTFDLAKDKFSEVIAEDRKYDIGGPAAPMTLMFHGSDAKLVGVRYERAKAHTLWLDDRFRKLQEAIDKKYQNKTNVISTWTADLGKVLFHSYNEENIGRIYIYYPNEKKMALQSYLSPDLENFRTGSTRIIEYKARDGHNIEAYLTLPPDAEHKALPLVVMPHGGPIARDSWGYDPFVQTFAARGYAVLQPNYRGSTGYGRIHLKAGFKALASLMIDDMADGAREMIDRGTADKNRVFIFGQSYGGYAAIMSAIRYHDLYKAAASAAAPLDLIKQINSHKDSDNYFAYDFWRTLAGDPKKEKGILKEISPYYRVEEIKIPLMIFHGADDPIISAEQVRDFEKIKDKAPAKIQTMIFKTEGHGFSVQNNNIHFMEKTLEHFANSLTPGAQNGH